MTVIQWLAENWLNLIQSVGIIGGCLFTAAAMKADRKSRQVGNLISITAQNRDIWSEFYARPALARVIDESVDLAKTPVTPAEQLFVQQLILHLAATWRAMEEGEFMHLQGLEADIKSFFSLPIPKFVWKTAKQYQDKDFVEFVDMASRE